MVCYGWFIWIWKIKPSWKRKSLVSWLFWDFHVSWRKGIIHSLQSGVIPCKVYKVFVCTKQDECCNRLCIYVAMSPNLTTNDWQFSSWWLLKLDQLVFFPPKKKDAKLPKNLKLKELPQNSISRCGRRWSYTSTSGTFRFLAFHSRFGRLSTLRLLEFWRICFRMARKRFRNPLPNHRLDVQNPANAGRNYLSTGAGFQPSTVLGHVLEVWAFFEHNTMSSCWIDLKKWKYRYCFYSPFPFSFLPKTE